MSSTQSEGSNGNNNQIDDGAIEVIEAGALESITRGEIDIQVRTAKMYPRNVTRAIDKAKSMAVRDEETAQSCLYALERKGKGGQTTYINGPSIRMAEIIAISWGNLRISGRIIGDDGRMVTAQGVCHDLENNVAILKDFKRRVTTKEGKRYGDDMIVMTQNAASSIAVRNAIFACVPMAAWKPVYLAAAALANGGGKPFEEVRKAWMEFFAKAKISPERYLAVVEKGSIDDLTLDDLNTFGGIQNKAKEEGQPFGSYFPEQTPRATEAPAAKSKPGKKTLDDHVEQKQPEPTKAVEAPKAATPAVDVKAVVDAYMALEPNTAANLREKFDFPNVTAMKQLPMATIAAIAAELGVGPKQPGKSLDDFTGENR